MKRACVGQVFHLVNQPRDNILRIETSKHMQEFAPGGTGEKVPPAQVNQGEEVEVWTRLDLVLAYRANRDVLMIRLRSGSDLVADVDRDTEGCQPACRCYRCGTLLTVHTVRPDTRLEGVTRPVCQPCLGQGE